MAGRFELLSPAGDMERLVMALTYGADAVYLSGVQFGMRAAAGGFEDEALAEAVRLCHERGVRVHAAVNTVPHNEDVRVLPAFLESLESAGADAVILSDIGVFALAKKYAPSLSLHVSTQAGVANYETARAFSDMGASRVILARELTLSEIAEIRENTPPELELEAFVHGSMCVSYSGRCLLSDYFTGRDANRGRCAQPCRWKYHLMEEKRPGEYLEISEDGGTYILNSRDLCMIGHIRELAEAGVDSFKIEGRTKSAYYVAVVTNAYRHVIDAVKSGETPDPVWLDEVNKVSHRQYATGFYFDKRGPGEYLKDSMYFSTCDVAAVVEHCSDEGEAVLTQRNRFGNGSALELLMPSGKPIPFAAECLRDAEGTQIEEAVHPMMAFRMRLPAVAPANSIIRKLK